MMFVRWQNSKTVARQKQKGKVNRCRAILVESVRVDGKSKQRYIAFIASYEPDVLDRQHLPEWQQRLRLGSQCRFWRDVGERLDRLGNGISPEVRHKIETALAAKVPRPSQEEQERHARKLKSSCKD
jgi:hypothetical protein